MSERSPQPASGPTGQLPTEKFVGDGFAFDDVLILPGRSECLPSEVEVRARLTRKITLEIPLVSAPMDTVTESELAIALAREGGLGFIHRNLSVEQQAAEVERVKRSESGMITDPITLTPEEPLSRAKEVMDRFHISGVPIVRSGKLVGILTNRDIRFVHDASIPISELMTSENLITAPVGTTLEEAKRILHKHRVEKLPVVDQDGNLRGLITVKDIQKREQYPLATKDDQGRLRAGAAIGVGEEARERAEALVEAGVDVLVVDTAHGHSGNVLSMVEWIKHEFDIEVVAGNIATPSAAEDLIKAGADGLRVGMGPGAICTTRIVAGVGVPQLTAVFLCSRAAHANGVPIIADGGIQSSGDIAKAIGAGSDTVMVGSLFAGTDEAPGELILHQGERFKEYRGMGSIGAMRQRVYARDRYAQEQVVEPSKLVAEGVEGQVPYKGPVSNVVYQLVGGLRAAFGYVGARTVTEMQQKARFVRQSAAGERESHPHDIVITKEAPNYRLR